MIPVCMPELQRVVNVQDNKGQTQGCMWSARHNTNLIFTMLHMSESDAARAALFECVAGRVPCGDDKMFTFGWGMSVNMLQHVLCSAAP